MASQTGGTSVRNSEGFVKMNFKIATFIIVIIVSLLLIRLQYIPQGYIGLQRMRMSILKHLNLTLSTNAKNAPKSKKGLFRFKVKKAKILNHRIAKYIAMEPSPKDKLHYKESDFHKCKHIQ